MNTDKTTEVITAMLVGLSFSWVHRAYVRIWKLRRLSEGIVCNETSETFEFCYVLGRIVCGFYDNKILFFSENRCASL